MPVRDEQWIPAVAVAGALGVVAYVGAWAVAGVWWTGYDPVAQAISELFAVGAPPGPARLVEASLIVSGLTLVPFGLALHRALPGRSAAGPALAAVAGVFTVLIVVFPCSAGCPGAGTSLTDTLHTAVAGAGYAALVATPLAVARRVAGHVPRFARWSALLGGVAAIGFVLRVLGVADPVAGLVQRGFNTTADVWFVLAAAVVARRVGRPVRTHP